jgi:hypothetical protein
MFKDKLTGYEAVIRFWGSDHPKNEPPPSPELPEYEVVKENLTALFKRNAGL